MEAAYQKIAEILVAQCGHPFEKAWLNAELSEGFSSIQYWCEQDGNRYQPELAVLQKSEVDDALHDLRNTMKPEKLEPWSLCTFTLFPDGRYTFDVKYPDEGK